MFGSVKRLGIVALLGLAGFVYLYFINPTYFAFAPKCIVKLTTGLSCPGCGIQRFTHAALHGHWAEAIHYNYFLALSLPYAALLLAGWVMPVSPIKHKLEAVTHHRYAIWAYVATFFVWFIIRNILKI